MRTWPRHPVIYEVSTWAWLTDLRWRYQRLVDLATVPEEEWDAIAAHGFDAVWFMGVWERSPAGIDISMRNQGLLEDFRRTLPDFSPEDNVGQVHRRGVLARSGTCSSRVSTSATTRHSMTGWNTGLADNVRLHVLEDLSYQGRMVRFIENHDEPRAAVTFPDGKSRAAAVSILTLPGARLLHEGQFEGWQVRLRSSWAAARESRSIVIPRPFTAAF